jgi:hypothetical protein
MKDKKQKITITDVDRVETDNEQEHSWNLKIEDLDCTYEDRDGSQVMRAIDLKCFGLSSESKEKADEDLFKDIQTFIGVHISRGSLLTVMESFGWKIESIVFTKEKA